MLAQLPPDDEERGDGRREAAQEPPDPVDDPGTVRGVVGVFGEDPAKHHPDAAQREQDDGGPQPSALHDWSHAAGKPIANTMISRPKTRKLVVWSQALGPRPRSLTAWRTTEWPGRSCQRS